MTVINTFKINGGDIPQPSDHSWKDRTILGTDGNGRNIYPAPREYELKWSLMSPTDFNTIYGYYLLTNGTGTVTVDLPQWQPTATYQFRSYSGTILAEPTYENYYENYYVDVKLTVGRINT